MHVLLEHFVPGWSDNELLPLVVYRFQLASPLSRVHLHNSGVVPVLCSFSTGSWEGGRARVTSTPRHRGSRCWWVVMEEVPECWPIMQVCSDELSRGSPDELVLMVKMTKLGIFLLSWPPKFISGLPTFAVSIPLASQSWSGSKLMSVVLATHHLLLIREKHLVHVWSWVLFPKEWSCVGKSAPALGVVAHTC